MVKDGKSDARRKFAVGCVVVRESPKTTPLYFVTLLLSIAAAITPLFLHYRTVRGRRECLPREVTIPVRWR